MLLLLACGGPAEISPPCRDTDGDGASCVDCDDADAQVYPGAVERCDGVDEDCDGEVDEDVTEMPTWYLDADGDGVGADPIVACVAPTGAVSGAGDCDDSDATAYPGAAEVVGNEVDEDCDGHALTWAPVGSVAMDSDAPRWIGEQEDAEFGAEFGFLPDMDGDGAPEIWATEPDYLVDGDDVGILHEIRSAGRIPNGTTPAAGCDLVGTGQGYMWAPVVGWNDGPFGVGLATSTAYDPVFRAYRGEPCAAVDADGAAVEWYADGVSGSFGSDLARLEDADGALIVAVGAPGHVKIESGWHDDMGSVQVLAITETSIERRAQLIGKSGADYHEFGTTVEAVDLTGDGVLDLVVGADSSGGGVSSCYGGCVYTFEGPFDQDMSGWNGSDLIDASAVVQASEHAMNLGAQLSTGDVDEDGHPEILIGGPAWLGSSGGRAWMFSTPLSGWHSSDEAGFQIASLDDPLINPAVALTIQTDLDGDARKDIAIADSHVITDDSKDDGSEDPGSAFLWYGAVLAGTVDPDDADAILVGPTPDAHFGLSIAGGADMDQDGYEDLLVGGGIGDYGAIYPIYGGPRP